MQIVRRDNITPNMCTMENTHYGQAEALVYPCTATSNWPRCTVTTTRGLPVDDMGGIAIGQHGWVNIELVHAQPDNGVVNIKAASER